MEFVMLNKDALVRQFRDQRNSVFMSHQIKQK